MGKNPDRSAVERAAATEGREHALRTALTNLVAAVRGLDAISGSGWGAVSDALAEADAALVRSEL